MGEFSSAKNIYDIMAISYGKIKDQESLLYNKYLESGDKYIFAYFRDVQTKLISNPSSVDTLEIINNLNRITLGCSDLTTYIAILKNIDKFFKYNDPIFLTSSYKEIAPLNSEYFRDDCLIFPKVEKNIFNNLETLNIKFRNKQHYDQSSINKYLNNYIIINRMAIKNVDISLFKYFNDELNETIGEIGIKMAVVPFSNKRNFIINNNTSAGKEITFNITYDNNEKENTINKYINSLKFLEDKDVDFVIFPEMAFINELVDELIKYFTENDSNIKLLFCGTTWSNKNNSLLVMSGDGRVIYKQNKISPFLYKESGITHIENIQNTNNKLNFIDIDNIGRIFNAICLDYIDALTIGATYKMLESNIVIVSSFNAKLEKFKTTSEEIAKNYHIISVIGNYCAAIYENYSKCDHDKNDNVVGYICMPCINTRTSNMDVTYLDYKIIDSCESNQCNENCIAIFHINPNDCIINNDFKSIYHNKC